MARKPAFLSKPLVAVLVLVLLTLAGFTAFDWYLGSLLSDISSQPPRVAASKAAEFLKDYGWSRRSEDAEALLHRALGRRLDAMAKADKHAEAAELCTRILTRYARGSSADRCRKSQMTLRISAARKQIADGKPDEALAALQALMRKGLKGAAKDLALREIARARMASLTLQGEDMPLDELAERVKEIGEQHQGSEVAGLARDLLTCRRLRRQSPGVLDAEGLQAALRCEALATVYADSPAGKAAKAFLDQLPGSVLDLQLVVRASPKLTSQPPPDDLLQETVSAWLAKAGRGGLIRKDGLRAGFKLKYGLEVAYSDKPGKPYRVAGERKACTRGRKMRIRVTLRSLAKGRTLWSGEFVLKPKEVELAKGATADNCPRAVLEGAMARFGDWLAASRQPRLRQPAAWK